jgi:hypothetical protein
MVQITAEVAAVGVSTCEGCGFHRDAMDTTDVPTLLSDSAMHAMSTGHVVNEVVSRSITIRPWVPA